MGAVILWGWDETNQKPRRVLVDTEGKVKIVAVTDKLDDIGDVNVPTPTDMQGILYDTSTSKWILTSYMLAKLLTARGDIVTRNATVPKRLALGTEGHYLKAGVNEPEWASVGVGSLVIWKDVPEQPLEDLNRTTTLDWTDLDLTAFTSANAKFALVQMLLYIDSISGAASCQFKLRKNGTTPDYYNQVHSSSYLGHGAAAVTYFFGLVGLDTNQVIEYGIGIDGTIQADCKLRILGYIE